ncbi:orotidine 5'-phosphate decarboxylase / HUMPS family protein [Staphylothermus hellenicus]|uniref:Orotidine 5'-phosphate decarboxylase n=1 Tax=Staphylothermus hellenicus (strain DSM 12710 / JCM 10830 / BK20S6-10-b1 / P8) TaxID=591019 RepID=D7DB13_STAHD|nr:orotidine 5'-phosphate decarboxylase / HUMPS family protein [Staphylothermus hellenicus]ADI31360.1 orotidine 5'-phosphate decarboxylase [Staphylothermus hellenicus DSM 12710]
MNSRIIVALDITNKPLNWFIDFINTTKKLVAGYKFGLPFLIRYGLEGFKEISKLIDNKHYWIIDFKLADIAPIMINTVDQLVKIGYNTYIAHAFIGLEGGLLKLKEFLSKHNSKLLLVASMSHKGSLDIIDKCLPHILEAIKKLKPWGLVAPATRPERIVEIKNFLLENNIPAKIFSPGIGAQGAAPGTAIRFGADYEIIGRMITLSNNPVKIIEETNKIHKDIVGEDHR